jgi:hypothetical protein
MGFALVGAGQVQFFLDDFVAFKKIASNDGVVSVVLSRTTLRRGCFSRTVVSTESRTFTFEFHKEANEWIGQRVDQLMLQFQRNNRLFPRPGLFKHPTSLDASGVGREGGGGFRN